MGFTDRVFDSLVTLLLQTYTVPPPHLHKENKNIERFFLELKIYFDTIKRMGSSPVLGLVEEHRPISLSSAADHREQSAA